MTKTSSPSPLAAAHQAIGAYFCAFSRVEHELGESVKVVFQLQGNEAADAIVAALGDVARKAGLVWAASKGAKNTDGSDASTEWKARVEDTIQRVFNCNQHDRVPLAHSLLQPNADGSVGLVRLKNDRGEVKGRGGVTWSCDCFGAKIEELDKLGEELRALNGELRTFKFTIASLTVGSPTLGAPDFEPTMGMMRPQGIPAVLKATTLPSG